MEKGSSEIKKQDFIDAVVRAAESIIRGFTAKGIEVNQVTTGRGVNDLKSELDERFKMILNPEARRRGTNEDGEPIYTDAGAAQYVLATYDETTKKYSDEITEALDKEAQLLDKTKTVEDIAREQEKLAEGGLK